MITIEQEMLNLYMQAEKDVLQGKSVTLRGEQMTMEDLEQIRAGRQEWERKVNLQSNSGKIYSLSRFN